MDGLATIHLLFSDDEAGDFKRFSGECPFTLALNSP